MAQRPEINLIENLQYDSTSLFITGLQKNGQKYQAPGVQSLLKHKSEDALAVKGGSTHY